MSKSTIPKALDSIADLVLSYRPKPKSKHGKKRKRLAAKLSKIAKSSSAPRQYK